MPISTCEEFKFRGRYDAAFVFANGTLSATLNEFTGIRTAFDESPAAGIRNLGSGIRNFEIWNPASYGIRNPPTYGIRNPRTWIRNPKRSWTTYLTLGDSWPRRNAMSYQPRNVNSSQNIAVLTKNNIKQTNKRKRKQTKQNKSYDFLTQCHSKIHLG